MSSYHNAVTVYYYLNLFLPAPVGVNYVFILVVLTTIARQRWKPTQFITRAMIPQNFKSWENSITASFSTRKWPYIGCSGIVVISHRIHNYFTLQKKTIYHILGSLSYQHRIHNYFTLQKKTIYHRFEEISTVLQIQMRLHHRREW